MKFSLFQPGRWRLARLLQKEPLGLRVILSLSHIAIGVGLMMDGKVQSEFDLFLTYFPAFFAGVIFFTTGVMRLIMSAFICPARPLVFIFSTLSTVLWAVLMVSGYLDPDHTVSQNLFSITLLADIWTLAYAYRYCFDIDPARYLK